MLARRIDPLPVSWQGVAEVLRDGDCPAVLTPSKPRESGVP